MLSLPNEGWLGNSTMTGLLGRELPMVLEESGKMMGPMSIELPMLDEEETGTGPERSIMGSWLWSLLS